MTQSQIKKVRLAHNWRRRSNHDAQLANARAETFALVAQALQQGEARYYGRGLFRTYLRVKYRHSAREDDIRDAKSVGYYRS